ncbi:hypothetical protein GW17_00035623 [Ensete ventricosum]|nr:hypothetical protein GW17_00035623 [Ensete ventricosum]
MYDINPNPTYYQRMKKDREESKLMADSKGPLRSTSIGTSSSYGRVIDSQSLELGLQDLHSPLGLLLQLSLPELGLEVVQLLGHLVDPGLGGHHRNEVHLLEFLNFDQKFVDYLGELTNDPLGVMHLVDQAHGEVIVLQKRHVNPDLGRNMERRGGGDLP